MKSQSITRFLAGFQLAALALLLVGVASSWGVAATPTQTRAAKALNAQIRKAGSLYTQGKFDESAEVVKAVQGKMAELAKDADDDMINLLEPVRNRVIRAHALLELEGIELPAIVNIEKPKPPIPPGGGISFVKQIAPLLIKKCENCHINNARGEFSMVNFAALMKGSSAGVVIFPGDASGSRIIEMIDSGDMPRGGGKVTPAEFKTLKDWITQGAKYDGEDPQVGLKTLAPDAVGQAGPALTVAKSTGKETVSFAGDIAAVLATNCNGCHVNAQRVRGGLNMSNFQGLLKGGDSGPPLVPGKPVDSLLIQRIKGEGGEARMPMGRTPLSDEVIGKIEKWISEGATFDGPNPNQDVVRVAALARAQSSTHEELSAARAELAGKNWRLGMPGFEAQTAITTNFLLMGSMGEASLQEYGETAEKLAPRVTAMVGAPSDEALVKGRMTLFFFRQRYDYSEFGQMVEKREIPRGWRGHWRYDIVDAYGALIPPRADEYSLDSLISEQLAATYVASLSDTPQWFADGVGRVVASRIAAKDSRVTAWNSELPGILGSLARPDDFLNGKIPPESAALAGYSFVKFLMKDSKRTGALLDALRGGERFAEAFAEIYGGSPAQATEIWARTASRRR
jgi:mono/diheme cytochrome c family protein